MREGKDRPQTIGPELEPVMAVVRTWVAHLTFFLSSSFFIHLNRMEQMKPQSVCLTPSCYHAQSKHLNSFRKPQI